MIATNTVTATEWANMSGPPAYTKDSLKSTWRHWNRSQWNIHHWIMEVLGLHPTTLSKPVPVHAKSDKVPYISHWQTHKWIIAHAVWPLLAHQLYLYWTGKNLHPLIAFAFYTFAFKANAIHELHEMRKLGHIHGYLDGDKHERDQVPDLRAGSVLMSLISTATVRPMASVFLAYRTSQSPLSTLSWWLPVEIGVYTVVLDFWYYCFHRLLHESDALWQFHRTHHLTKHPTPLLTLYADTVQEVFDIIGVPIATYLTMKLVGLPMEFADWWICQQYIVWVELWGHSGLRIYLTTPTTATPLLKFFDAELTTEDHDLHHRKGWKTSHNYGKQTRLWDRLFGTCHERYESIPANIDFNDRITLPLW